MSSGEDPVAWLRAQVEARKAAAKLAAREGGTWTQDDPVRYPGSISSLGGQVVYDEGSPDEYQAVHIALNDPQDTIARCEAELAILGEHRLVVADRGLPEQGQSTGSARGYRIVWEHPTAEQIANAPMMWRDLDCRECRKCFPCRTVRLLASGYRHREGYPESFASTTDSRS